MMMPVLAAVAPGLAKVKKPDQRAGQYQQKRAEHDEKIHPFRGYPACGWHSVIHGVKIKSGFRVKPVRRQVFSSGILSPKSIFNRCIR
jgi:hypothetical protein